MKIFISGEVAKKAAEDYGPIVSDLQNKINSEIENHDYGFSLEKISVIPTIFDLQTYVGLNYKERTLYKKLKKEADYRLAIDYDKFVNAGKKGKEKLIIENIINCVQLLGEKIGKGFNAKKLESDIRDLFKETLN